MKSLRPHNSRRSEAKYLQNESLENVNLKNRLTAFHSASLDSFGRLEMNVRENLFVRHFATDAGIEEARAADKDGTIHPISQKQN